VAFDTPVAWLICSTFWNNQSYVYGTGTSYNNILTYYFEYLEMETIRIRNKYLEQVS